jgi:hypothetical protein
VIAVSVAIFTVGIFFWLQSGWETRPIAKVSIVEGSIVIRDVYMEASHAEHEP